MQSKIPPSVLPDISPSRGEIGFSTGAFTCRMSRRSKSDQTLEQGACDEAISPLEGEMSGRTEGGVQVLPVIGWSAHVH